MRACGRLVVWSSRHSRRALAGLLQGVAAEQVEDLGVLLVSLWTRSKAGLVIRLGSVQSTRCYCC